MHIWNTCWKRLILCCTGKQLLDILTCCCICEQLLGDINLLLYKVVQIWPGLIVCKQVSLSQSYLNHLVLAKSYWAIVMCVYTCEGLLGDIILLLYLRTVTGRYCSAVIIAKSYWKILFCCSSYQQSVKQVVFTITISPYRYFLLFNQCFKACGTRGWERRGGETRAKRTTERYGRRWKYNIQVDFIEMGREGIKFPDLVQDTEKWRGFGEHGC
jgi:hypothetical protein